MCKVIEVPKSGQSTFSVEYLPLPFDVPLVEGKENLAVYIDVNKDKKTIINLFS
jgi:hypothetical protein